MFEVIKSCVRNLKLNMVKHMNKNEDWRLGHHCYIWIFSVLCLRDVETTLERLYQWLIISGNEGGAQMPYLWSWRCRPIVFATRCVGLKRSRCIEKGDVAVFIYKPTLMYVKAIPDAITHQSNFCTSYVILLIDSAPGSILLIPLFE